MYYQAFEIIAANDFGIQHILEFFMLLPLCTKCTRTVQNNKNKVFSLKTTLKTFEIIRHGPFQNEVFPKFSIIIITIRKRHLFPILEYGKILECMYDVPYVFACACAFM